MKEFVLGIVRTKTIRQSGVTFAGTFLNGLLGIIFYILTARFLGPIGFGIFSVAIAALSLASDISSLGTDTGIVRFVGKYINTDRNKALRFLKLSLEVKFLVWIFVLIVGWLTAPLIARNILAKPELSFPLQLSMIGVGSGLFFSFTTNSLQAIQKFWEWSGLNIATNALRLLFVGLFIYSGFFSVASTLLAYIIAPFMGFLVGFTFLPSFLSVKNESSVARELFHYNKWVALFILVAAVSSRLDTFLATRLLSLAEVGIYSVAVSLASVVPQIVYALGVVVAPKLAGFDSKEKAITYLKKLQLFVLGLAFSGLLVGIPASYVVIPRLYGSQYLASISPFIILLFAQAVFLISTPVHTSVFYYFAKPSLFVWISLGHLAIIGGLGYFLISQFGYMGAATVVLLGTIFNFIVPAIWVIKKFREK